MVLLWLIMRVEHWGSSVHSNLFIAVACLGFIKHLLLYRCLRVERLACSRWLETHWLVAVSSLRLLLGFERLAFVEDQWVGFE